MTGQESKSSRLGANHSDAPPNPPLLQFYFNTLTIAPSLHLKSGFMSSGYVSLKCTDQMKNLPKISFMLEMFIFISQNNTIYLITVIEKVICYEITAHPCTKNDTHIFTCLKSARLLASFWFWQQTTENSQRFLECLDEILKKENISTVK